MWHFVARDLILRKGFLICAILPTSGYLATSTPAFAQASDQVTTSPAENQAPFQLKVTSNLVVVRVVVRDAQNKPIENLKKEDFKLFDRGKQQSISQFAVETPAARPPGPAPAVTSGQASISVAPASAIPELGRRLDGASRARSVEYAEPAAERVEPFNVLSAHGRRGDPTGQWQIAQIDDVTHRRHHVTAVARKG